MDKEKLIKILRDRIAEAADKERIFKTSQSQQDAYWYAFWRGRGAEAQSLLFEVEEQL